MNVRRTITSINLKKISNLSLELEKSQKSKSSKHQVDQANTEKELSYENSSLSNSSKRLGSSKIQKEANKIVIIPPVSQDLDSLSDRKPKNLGSKTDLISTEKKPEKQAQIVNIAGPQTQKNTLKQVKEKEPVENLLEPKKEHSENGHTSNKLKQNSKHQR